jgi:hypothetical protein
MHVNIIFCSFMLFFYFAIGKIIYLDLVRCHLCRERVISTVSFCFLNLDLCYNKNTCSFEFDGNQKLSFDVTLILCVLGIFI